MPEIDISKLARLDELEGRATEPPPPSPAAAFASRAAPAVDVDPSAFVPPAEEGEDLVGVERSTRAIRIENQWAREKAVKQAVAALPPPKPRLRIAGVLAAVLAICAVVAAVVVILGYRRMPPPERPGIIHGTGQGSAISIRITAPAPVDVTVDGQRAGKTPLTLHRTRSTQAIEIVSPHGAKRIVPDRDQVVELAPR